MPKRNYRWWSSVLRELQDPESTHVVKALKYSEKKITKWDYDLLIDCLNRRYIHRTKTLFQIACDHGTTEKVCWTVVRNFIFCVAAEMGYLQK